jgi:hypothetical protein
MFCYLNSSIATDTDYYIKSKNDAGDYEIFLSNVNYKKLGKPIPTSCLSIPSIPSA